MGLPHRIGAGIGAGFCCQDQNFSFIVQLVAGSSSYHLFVSADKMFVVTHRLRERPDTRDRPYWTRPGYPFACPNHWNRFQELHRLLLCRFPFLASRSGPGQALPLASTVLETSIEFKSVIFASLVSFFRLLFCQCYSV